MRSLFPAALAVCLLAGCTKTITDASRLTPEQDVIRSEFALKDDGKKALPAFLDAVDMQPLGALKQFGGSEELTSTLCRWIYTRHNEDSPIVFSDEACGWNLRADQLHFTSNGAPLTLAIKQLDDHLLLMLWEEGHGAPRLMTAAYDLKNGDVRPITLDEYGDTDLYYDLGTLYLVRDARIVATYDLDKGELTHTEQETNT